MHEHSHESNHSHNQNNTRFVIRHLILLAIVIAVAAALYIVSQNTSLVAVSIIALILAHVIGVLAIISLGRSFITRAIRKFHGIPDTPRHDDSHNHRHDLETIGETISWARLYDVFARFAFMGEHQKMLKSTIQIANIQANETVLDVGCGTGTLAIAAKQASHASVVIHALDASAEMIARARQKASAEGVIIEFTHGLVENIEMPDNSYNLVMNSLMIHHLPESLRSKAFAEIYRVLKPGGRLLIVDFEPPKDRLTRAWLSLTPVKKMLQIDNSSISPLLQVAGFENIEIGATASRIASYISARKP